MRRPVELGLSNRSMIAGAEEASDLICRVRQLRAMARHEVSNAILRLDLAVQRARLTVAAMGNPELDHAVDEQLSMIEELLRISRDQARAL